jgi:lipoprotein-anchoring transpeptidase ErfK/SrfK
MLDRAGFSPGVIDGRGGGNTEAAIRAFQRANGMTVDGKAGSAVVKALRDAHGGRYIRAVQIKERDRSKSFQPVPSGMAEQAEADHLGYEGLDELLAERYHMDIDLLRAMNPDVDWESVNAGDPVLVVRAGPAKLDRTVDRIVISKSENALRAYSGDTLVARYPATVGSSEMPSPSGEMTVRAVAPEATYTFNPDTNDWGGDEALQIAAGPNNPVGGVWIDLSKDTYGIHGTPDPALIGKTASHGCVRLTNWDARELADAVETGAAVEFVG